MFNSFLIFLFLTETDRPKAIKKQEEEFCSQLSISGALRNLKRLCEHVALLQHLTRQLETSRCERQKKKKKIRHGNDTTLRQRLVYRRTSATPRPPLIDRQTNERTDGRWPPPPTLPPSQPQQYSLTLTLTQHSISSFLPSFLPSFLLSFSFLNNEREEEEEEEELCRGVSWRCGSGRHFVEQPAVPAHLNSAWIEFLLSLPFLPGISARAAHHTTHSTQ